ncbi:hypothetical protein [Flavobacterium sp.]
MGFFIGWGEHHARDHWDFINLACVYEQDVRASMSYLTFILHRP